MPNRASWRDRHGDVWTEGDDGLLHTPETQPFPREHVERKWGPLVQLTGRPGVTLGPCRHCGTTASVCLQVVAALKAECCKLCVHPELPARADGERP